MRLGAVFLLLFFAFAGKAQTRLWIETEATQAEGFRLCVNGFWQNQGKASRSLALQELPEAPWLLHFYAPREERLLLVRAIELPAKGWHRYVLTENFLGEIQLRYRGAVNASPPSPQNFSALAPHPPSQSEVLAFKEKPHPGLTAPTGLPAKAAPGTPKKTAAPLSFAQQKEQLARQSFEFERLQYAKAHLLQGNWRAEEVVAFLRCFRYEETRMQFLQALLEAQPGLRYSGDLFKAEFRYRANRERVSKLLL